MIQESLTYRVLKAANVLLLSLLVVIMVFPYFNVFAHAFNDAMDSQRGGITFYPRHFTMDNFRVLFENKEIIRAIFVSVLRVVIGTAFALAVQYTSAYAFTLKDVKGRNAILVFLVIPMYFSGGLIPTYLLYSKIHMLNNFLVYVLPISFSLYNMVVIRSFLYTIPDSLAESARIDGANEFAIMLRIYVPLSLPIIAVLALWSAVGHWNDWTTTLYYVTDRKLFTLQYILMQILREGERISKLMEEALKSGLEINQSQQKVTPTAIRSANIILTTLPIVIVYPFLQKYFVKGINLGAVKE